MPTTVRDDVVRIWLLGVRTIVGAIFVAAAIPKFIQPYDFLASVCQYQLVTGDLAVFIAEFVPWIELFLGASLILGLVLRGSLLASALLLTIFAAVRGWAVVRGLEISCGCFQAGGQQIGYVDVAQGLSLAVFSLSGFALAFRVGSDASAHGAPAKEAMA